MLRRGGVEDRPPRLPPDRYLLFQSWSDELRDWGAYLFPDASILQVLHDWADEAEWNKLLVDPQYRAQWVGDPADCFVFIRNLFVHAVDYIQDESFLRALGADPGTIEESPSRLDVDVLEYLDRCFPREGLRKADVEEGRGGGSDGLRKRSVEERRVEGTRCWGRSGWVEEGRG